MEKIEKVLPVGKHTGYKHGTILHIKGTNHKLMVCSVREGESGRRVFEGPQVDGPWADCFRVEGSLVGHDNFPDYLQEYLRTLEVEKGDIIEVDDNIYQVEILRNEFINLHLMDREWLNLRK